MIKVESRAELGALKGKAPAPTPAPPVIDPTAGIQALALAMQESAALTQRSVLILAEAMMQSKPAARSESLVAEVERDEKGKMTRVVISRGG